MYTLKSRKLNGESIESFQWVGVEPETEYPILSLDNNFITFQKQDGKQHSVHYYWFGLNEESFKEIKQTFEDYNTTRFKKPLVLNLYGGPGCGKSTMATRLFSELKSMNVRCEYVSEYAKDVTYAEDWNKLADQLYITAKQNRKMNIVADKVDLIITDCPILLGRHYAPVEYFNGVFGELVMQIYNSYDNINILLNRKKQYQPYGRSQTEEEAKEIDDALEYLLTSHDIPFEKFDGTFDSVDSIVEIVLEKLKATQ